MYYILKYNTSPIDWCEPNYIYNIYINEFYNTLSSFVILYYGIKGYNKYNKFIWILYQLIGIFSIYFHLTLSYIGELLDELSILIIIIYTLFYLSKKYNLNYKNLYHWLTDQTIKIYKNIFIPIRILYFTLLILLLFIYSEYNPYKLFLSVPLMYIYITQYLPINNIFKKKLKYLTFLFFISFLIWKLDRLCINFIHLHWLWHICIGYVSYKLIELTCIDSIKFTQL